MASPELDNLKIQQEINAAIAARGKLLTSQTSLIADQTELAIKFCKAMKCEGIDEISDRITEIRAGLESAGRAATSATDGINSVTAGLGSAAGGAEDLSTSIGEVEGALDKAEKSGNSFGENFGNALGGVSRVLGSTVEAVWNIGTAILAIPLGIFDMMLGKAAELASGSGAIRQAYEDVREQFGSTSEEFSSQVIGASAELAKELKAAGTSIGAVYGHGPEGAAAAIADCNAMAVTLGASINLLGTNFAKTLAKLVFFQDGLGLANEDMKGFVYASKAVGTDVVKDLEAVSKISKEMAKKFSMSSKDIARDMGYLTTNSGKFGRLTKTAMAAASVSVRSYGLELKDVVGILDQFSDFESAANSASKFAQSFGASIDPMKMMKEEDPGKAFAYLRQQMLAAGNDSSTFNKAQIKQLATLTGMDENLVRVGFSAKNAGKSYEQVQKEADKASKKQKTQAEIMKDVADSIKKVIEMLQHSGSFWDEFITGFGEGMARSESMKTLMKDLAHALEVVRRFGREVGDMFVKAFPGVKDMLGAMSLFFSGDFLKLIDSFKVSIGQFFDDLNKDPATALEKFYESIKKNLLDVFDSSSGTGKMFLGAADKFMMAISGILAGLVKSIGTALTDGLKQLVAFIKNPDAALAAAGDVGSTFMGPIMQSLAEVLPGLFAALGELLWAGVVALRWQIAEALGYVLAFAVTKALAVGLVTSAWNAALAKLFSVGAKSAAVKARDSAGRYTKAVEGNKGLIATLAGMKPSEVAKAGINLGILIVFVGVALAAFGAALMFAMSRSASVSANQIVKFMGTIGIALFEAGLVVKGASLMKADEVKKATPTLIAIGVVALALGALGAALMYMISESATPDVATITTFLAAVAAVIVMTGVTILAAIGIDKLMSMAAGGAVGVAICLAAIGVVALALGGLGMAIMWMIDNSPNVDRERVITFLETIAAVLVMAGLTILAAIGIGTIIGGTAGLGGAAIALGVIAIGAVAIALGGLGQAIMVMIDLAPEVKKERVTTFLSVISAIITAVGLVIPLAVQVGALLLASLGTITGAFTYITKLMTQIGTTIKGVVEIFALVPDEAADKVEKMMPAINTITDMLFKGLESIISVASTIRLSGSDSITKGMKIVNETMSSLSQTLATALTTIDATVTGDPAVIEKKVNIIAQLIQSLSPITNIVTAGLELAKVDPTKAAAAMVAATGLAEALSTNLGDMVKTLAAAAGGLKDEDIKKAAALGGLLGAVGTMMSGLAIPKELMAGATSTSKSEDHWFTADTTEITATAASATTVTQYAEAMKSLLGALGPAISSIVEAMQKIDIGKGDEAKLFVTKFETISKLLTALGAFSTIVDLLKGGTESNAGIRGIKRLTELFTDGTFQNLVNEVSKVTIPPTLEAAAEGLKSMTKVFPKLADLGKAYQKYANELPADIDTMLTKDKVNAIKERAKLLGDLGASIATSTAGMSSFTKVDPAPMFNFLTEFANAGADFGNSDAMGNFESTLGLLDRMATTMSGFENAYSNGLSTFLEDAVADMRALDKILNKLDVAPIDVTIDSLAKKLHINKESIQIEHKPININMTMNITFNAEEFTKDIMKSAATLVKTDRLPNLADIGASHKSTFVDNPNKARY